MNDLPQFLSFCPSFLLLLLKSFVSQPTLILLTWSRACSKMCCFNKFLYQGAVCSYNKVLFVCCLFSQQGTVYVLFVLTARCCLCAVCSHGKVLFACSLFSQQGAVCVLFVLTARYCLCAVCCHSKALFACCLFSRQGAVYVLFVLTGCLFVPTTRCCLFSQQSAIYVLFVLTARGCYVLFVLTTRCCLFSQSKLHLPGRCPSEAKHVWQGAVQVQAGSAHTGLEERTGLIGRGR